MTSLAGFITERKMEQNRGSCFRHHAQDTNNGKKQDDGYTHTRQGKANTEADHSEHDTPSAQLFSSSALSLSELMRNSAETSGKPPNITTDLQRNKIACVDVIVLCKC